MKEFLLFANDDYCQSGGMGDYIGDFNSVDEAKEFVKIRKSENAQIVEYKTMKVVCEFGQWGNTPRVWKDYRNA